MPPAPRIDAVVFDIGGVLIDWSPAYLYEQLFPDPDERRRFLTEVATLEWHAAHDRGVGYAENAAPLIAAHPEHADAIRAWSERGEEMERGEIAGSVRLLRSLVDARVPVYALTNMESDTYERRVVRYPFMSWFAGSVVSSHEGVVKPDPELFRRLIDRYGLRPPRTLLIDDSEANARTAAELGFQTIRFRSPEQLRAELTRIGLLPPPLSPS